MCVCVCARARVRVRMCAYVRGRVCRRWQSMGIYYIETWRPLLAQPLDVVSERARRWDGGQEGGEEEEYSFKAKVLFEPLARARSLSFSSYDIECFCRLVLPLSDLFCYEYIHTE